MIFQFLTIDYKKNFDRIKVLKPINTKVNQADKFKNNSEKIIEYFQERPIKNAPLQEKIASL